MKVIRGSDILALGEGMAELSRIANASDPDLHREVARMISEWEASDELPTEFAGRLIAHIVKRTAPSRDRTGP